MLRKLITISLKNTFISNTITVNNDFEKDPVLEYKNALFDV